jgi:NAD(P)-dependent dehydrogenase (short-subunit alcohol dehydrogenase family)
VNAAAGRGPAWRVAVVTMWKRSVQPGDMAGAVAPLASDEAAMIGGQALRIDGGLVTL